MIDAGTRADDTVRVSEVVEASAEAAWRAWTQCADKQRWWGRSEGLECHLCEMDVRVGGTYRYGMRPIGTTGGGADVTGAYLVVEPPRRLVYTWNWTQEEPVVRDTLVTVTFEDLEGDRCRVSVVHERQPSARIAAIHTKGWTHKLADFAAALASG